MLFHARAIVRRPTGRLAPALALVLLLFPWHAIQAAGDAPFAIHVVDDATGRGVPLVELKTVNSIVYVTDSAGYVAFDEPGLMDQTVHFTVSSHGYEFPADGFRIRGKALAMTPGGHAELRLKRLNVAERLYRVTGQGIYADSTRLGLQAPIDRPNLNAQVLGQDSVLTAVYGGKLHWFWGDTNRPSYPLGNFHTPGATSELPGKGGLDPSVGVNLTYYTDKNGFARPTCQMPGDGPTWVSALTVLRDGGTEHMFASFAKIKPPLETYERGFAEWDAEHARFEKRGAIPVNAPLRPDGHPLMVGPSASDSGPGWVYFPQPIPMTRVPATVDAFQDLGQYEGFTCLKPGSTEAAPEVERDAAGRPVHGWKREALPLGPAEQAKLLKAGSLKETERWIVLRDIETGKPVQPHGGSVFRLPDEKSQSDTPRYAMIFVEVGGSASMLGEVWYAEAISPLGPWAYARKVATHDRYSFYNPRIHDAFSDGRWIYFEGTYTTTFSGNPNITPRYEYNQLMYRIDRDDPRLVLPAPLPDQFREPPAGEEGGRPPSIRFFACQRPFPNSVELVLADPGTGRLQVRGNDRSLPGRFHALPADIAEAPPGTALLFEYTNDVGTKLYDIEREDPPAGWVRAASPVARVWKAEGIWDRMPIREVPR